jgi:hypothetical protein
MVGLGQPMLDTMLDAGGFERMGAPFCGCSVTVLGQIGELDAIVGQDGVNMIGHGGDEGFQERFGRLGVGTFMQLHEDEFRGAIDSDEEMKFTFRASNFSDVDMEITNGVGPELFLVGFVACHLPASG